MDNAFSPVHELIQNRERLDMALKVSGSCIFEVDLIRQRYTYFQNAEDIFHVSSEKIMEDVQAYSTLPPEEYQKEVSSYFSHPDDFAVIDEAFRHVLGGEPWVYEARMRAGNSEYVWCRVHVTPIMENGIPVRMIGVLINIDDIKREAEALKQVSQTDMLTGLYNRSSAEARIRRILDQSSQDQNHALLLLDLDDFKGINDTYGHQVGEQAIREVADKLRSLFRKSDVLGRWGGDEFLVLVRDIADSNTLEEERRQLSTFRVGTGTALSTGFGFYPREVGNFYDLFAIADQRLYLAKKKKGKRSRV